MVITKTAIICLQLTLVANGTRVFGPQQFTCVAAATAASNTTVAVRPKPVQAGTSAALLITPRVSISHQEFDPLIAIADMHIAAWA